jgi:pimeloyl-ACP methyl ester carboxylesterase
MADLMEKLLEAKGVETFSVYLMDYGAPIGYRIAVKHPKRIQGLVIQNGCAYEEGLLEFWDPIKKYWKDKTPENGEALEGFHSPEGLKWQYTHGVPDSKHISPDNWEIDLRHLTRPENNEIQLAMFLNDLPGIFNEEDSPAELGDIKFQCLLYADDLVLISETEEGLQSAVSKLHEFCSLGGD